MKNAINEQILKERKKKLEIELFLTENKEVLQEGFYGKLASILGITIGSLFSALGQGNISQSDLSKLSSVYGPNEINKLEIAMKDSLVQKALKKAGAVDNNIGKVVENLDALKKAYTVKTLTKTAHNDKALASLLKSGYHLNSVDVDTLERIVQEEGLSEEIIVDSLMLGDNYFKSGRFIPNEQTVNLIKQKLDSIKSIPGSMITGVVIESSTDKQGLTIGLQKDLIELGYKPNNQGLSAARNSSIKEVVLSDGIDESIINQIKLYEQGSETIDQSARYVRIFVSYYIVKLTPDMPDFEDKFKNTYELFKVISSGKPKSPNYSGSICKKNFKWNKKARLKKDKIADCFFKDYAY